MNEEEIIRAAAARVMGRSRSANKSAANPVVADRMRVTQPKATAAAAKVNTKPLEDIACCGRDPHLKSCLRWRAMQRRK